MGPFLDFVIDTLDDEHFGASADLHQERDAYTAADFAKAQANIDDEYFGADKAFTIGLKVNARRHSVLTPDYVVPAALPITGWQRAIPRRR